MSNLTYPVFSQGAAERDAIPLRSRAARKLADLLAVAGVRVNGSEPWDLRVGNEAFFERVLSYGTLGAGESYMDGWWDAEALDLLLERVHRADLQSKLRNSLIL